MSALHKNEKERGELHVESPLYVLVSQEDALSRRMDVAAQNMANVNTTGYKSQGMVFEDFIKKPDPRFTHHLVLDRATYRDTTAGTLLPTDNPLDLAIQGPGYYAVNTPEGTQYTRAGSFVLDTEGNVVTPEGYPLLSGGGQPITIPTEAQRIAIGRDGTISTEIGNAGKLSVVRFENEQGLKPTHSGLYSTDETPVEDSTSSIVQGMVEASNVKPVAEMTNIIDVSRSYQWVANLINAENDRLRNAVRVLGRTA
jgi:flagellar basal-body rod protein FlgF